MKIKIYQCALDLTRLFDDAQINLDDISESDVIEILTRHFGGMESEIEQAKADRNRAGMLKRNKYLPEIQKLTKDRDQWKAMAEEMAHELNRMAKKFDQLKDQAK